MNSEKTIKNTLFTLMRWKASRYNNDGRNMDNYMNEIQKNMIDNELCCVKAYSF